MSPDDAVDYIARGTTAAGRCCTIWFSPFRAARGSSLHPLPRAAQGEYDRGLVVLSYGPHELPHQYSRREGGTLSAHRLPRFTVGLPDFLIESWIRSKRYL